MLCGGEPPCKAAAHSGILARRLVACLLQYILGFDREILYMYLESLPIRCMEETKNSFLLVLLPDIEQVNAGKKKERPLLLDFEFVLDPLVSIGLAKAWGWRLNSCVAKSILYEEHKGISSTKNDHMLLLTLK